MVQFLLFIENRNANEPRYLPRINNTSLDRGLINRMSMYTAKNSMMCRIGFKVSSFVYCSAMAWAIA